MIMRIKEAFEKWKQAELPGILESEQDGQIDKPLRWESWYNFIHLLYESGEITDSQVQNWGHPKGLDTVGHEKTSKVEESVFLVYKTDTWHSYSSRDLIGVCTSKEIVIDICKKQAKKEGSKIDKEQLFNLDNIRQTQGYAGDGEFAFEEANVNILL